MSHFYGSLKGERGETTRRGTVKSGMISYVASHTGAVRTELYHKDGVDYVRIDFQTWQGQGTNKLIYEGPVNPPKEG